MKILPANKANIKIAARIIRQGGLVAFPTETVYGLGANVFNALAVARIFEVKQRPEFDPIIIHIASVEDINLLWRQHPESALRLIESFWPGPLTLIGLKSPKIPELVTAGLDTAAVRMPNHPVALALIKEAGRPIAAPSANLFGHLSPTNASHVAQQLGSQIDLILDGGQTPVGIESTVLDLTGEPTLLRPGGTPLEEIEKVIGPIKIAPPSSKPLAPGQLPHHYAPRTPLLIKQDKLKLPAKLKVGYLAFCSPPTEISPQKIEILTPSKNLREAAANLFAALHRLDQARVDVIIAEPVPEEGLGRAIMDRLRKAASSTYPQQ